MVVDECFWPEVAEEKSTTGEPADLWPGARSASMMILPLVLIGDLEHLFVWAREQAGARLNRQLVSAFSLEEAIGCWLRGGGGW